MILKGNRVRVSWIGGLSFIFVGLIAALSASPASAQAELVVDKRGNETVEEGQVIIYEIDVENTGNASAPDVKLTDEVPAGTSFVSVSPVGNCGEDGGTVTCNLGNVTANRPSVTVTLQVRADGTEDTIKNTATAASGDLRDSDSVTTTLGSANGNEEGNANNQYTPNVEVTNIINVPGKDLPDTGGPHLLAIFFSVVAGAGLLTALVRLRY